MAYRELGMAEVREIVRRWLGGEGVRAIARGTGMDRKTIAEYIRAAVGVQRGGRPPNEDQVAAIAAARRPGRPTNTARAVRSPGCQDIAASVHTLRPPSAGQEWTGRIPPSRDSPWRLSHADLITPRPT
jgi:hypothetical protein